MSRAGPGGLRRAGVAALALILLAASPFVGAGAQPWLLVVATAAGLPHGALDGARGRRVFGSMQGARWVVPFGLFYLGLAAAVLLAWHVAPGMALLGFLLLSVAHFGEADGTGEGPAQRIARGGLPVVIPTLAHPAMVERLFGWLAGDAAGPVEHILAGPVAAVWAIAFLIAMGRWIGDARRGAWGPLAEAAALVLLFAYAPPLVAFAIYFVAIHTPRALSASAADFSAANPPHARLARRCRHPWRSSAVRARPAAPRRRGGGTGELRATRGAHGPAHGARPARPPCLA